MAAMMLHAAVLAILKRSAFGLAVLTAEVVVAMVAVAKAKVAVARATAEVVMVTWRARLCHPLARRWLQRRRLLWPGPRRRAAAWRPASSSSTVAFVDVTLRGLCIGTRIEASSSVSARAAQLLFLCCGVKDVLR